MQNSLFVRTPWGEGLVSWQPRKRRNGRAVEREAAQRAALASAARFRSSMTRHSAHNHTINEPVRRRPY